jgi:hypothetical protein
VLVLSSPTISTEMKRVLDLDHGIEELRLFFDVHGLTFVQPRHIFYPNTRILESSEGLFDRTETVAQVTPQCNEDSVAVSR